MNRYAVYHMCSGTFAYATDKNAINVRIRTAKNDCTSVYVHYLNVYDHTSIRKIEKMDKILTDEYFDMYEAKLMLKEKHFKYFFELVKDDEKVFYTGDGFMEKDIRNENSFFFPVINDDEVYTYPKWAEGALVYQVFIDRFNSSGSKSYINAKWNKYPLREDFFGGDFAGIIEKLDYMRSLGTDVIYLGPVFSSRTNHKYDIEDYYSIDEMFGGEQGLTELVKAIHKKGMRIVLDCVFNHMSCYNPIFMDVVEKGQASEYKDWFFIYDYPVEIEKGNYDTFAGCVPSMPRINTANEQAIKYLVDSAVYWTKKLGIDGWRLDVADEVSVSLWKKFRKEVQKANSETLVIGEIWNDAAKWMNGDQIHTVTNYKYRKWMLDFIQGIIDSDKFWDRISSNSMLYKTSSYGYLINLLGSHDTVRLSSMIGTEKAKLALLTTMAFHGMCLIYYGDEIGLLGAEDPDNRRTMPWDDITNDKYDYIHEFSILRNEYPVLRYGQLIPLMSDKKLLAFERKLNGQTLEVYVNFSDEECFIEKKNAIFMYSAKDNISHTEKTGIDRIGPLAFAICIKI